jgi:hypothetical protein
MNSETTRTVGAEVEPVCLSSRRSPLAIPRSTLRLACRTVGQEGFACDESGSGKSVARGLWRAGFGLETSQSWSSGPVKSRYRELGDIFAAAGRAIVGADSRHSAALEAHVASSRIRPVLLIDEAQK